MLLSLLLLALAALPSPPDAGVRRARAVDCEALLALGPAEAETLAAAAERCRAEDAVLAFGLSQRALALAPDAPGVRLAHARSLLALGERGAAAQLLDEALRRPGATPSVRLLRAELAEAEGEPERMLAVLQPLAHLPRVRARLERARAQVKSRAGAREALAAQQRGQELREQEAAARAGAQTPPGARPGHEVWGTRGSVESGGQRTFRLRNVRAGEHYVLLATGQCRLPAPAKKRRRTLPAPRDLFGVDFRARVGTLEAWPLRVGLDPERSAYAFRAPEDEPQLFVEDRSSAHAGVRCSVSDLAVRVP